MKDRAHNLIIAILLAVGFFLRVYAANSVPLIGDEEEKFLVAKEVSFSPRNLNLPIGSKVTKRPLLSVYLLKITTDIFGQNKIISRLPFIALSIISLFFIYRLVQEYLNKRKALLTLALLTFSQYHIGVSRLIDENTLLLFFCSLSLFFFFKFINTQKNKWLLFLSLAVGGGYLSKELIILLIPVFAIFFLSRSEYRKLFCLKKKEIFISFIAAFLIASPHLLWSIQNKFYNFTFKQQHKIGFSLRSFYLYFADFPVIMDKYQPEMFIWPPAAYRVQEDRERTLRKEVPRAFYFTKDNKLKIRMDGVYEYPAVDLITGILIFLAVFYLLFRSSKKEDLIKFSLIMFLVVFIAPCLFDPSSLLAYHYWASMSFFPGMILAGHVLERVINMRLIFGALSVTFLIIYSLIHALFFVKIPENYYLAPRSEFYAYCLDRVELYRKQNKYEDAFRVLNWLSSGRLDAKTKFATEKELGLIRRDYLQKGSLGYE